MTTFLTVYTMSGLIFAATALWLRDPNCTEPWLKSIVWSIGIGVLWPIALIDVIYTFITTRKV